MGAEIVVILENATGGVMKERGFGGLWRNTPGIVEAIVNTTIRFLELRTENQYPQEENTSWSSPLESDPPGRAAPSSLRYDKWSLRIFSHSWPHLLKNVESAQELRLCLF